MKKIVLLSYSVAMASSLYAGGFKIALQGIKQDGMAGCGVGIALDAASIYYNPAAISFVAPQINLGVNALLPNTTFLDKNTGITTNTDSKVYTPFNAYATFKIRKKLTGGLGVYTPFGSGVQYPAHWAGNNILTKIKLNSVFFQPTLAYKITNNISIGAGLTVAMGSVELNKNLPVTNSNGNDVTASLKGNSATKFGANLGAYISQNDWSGGITYHSRINMDVKSGTATFANVPAGLASGFPNTAFATTLPLPSEVALGVGYHHGKWLFALDYNYTFWNAYKSLDFDFATNTTSLLDTKSPRNYQNAGAIRFGLQHACSNKFTYRAGVFYDHSPVQDGYVSPELPDGNKFGLTAGASAKLGNNFVIDASLLYENVMARTQTNLESNLYGTFQTKVLAPAIGISYIFHKKPVTQQ